MGNLREKGFGDVSDNALRRWLSVLAAHQKLSGSLNIKITDNKKPHHRLYLGPIQ